MRHLIPALLAAAAISAAPAATAREKLAPEDQLAKLLEGRVAGKPQSCIPLSTTRSSQIIDKTAIVYRSGGKLWVNRTANPEDIDDDDILVIRRFSGSSLCRQDMITLTDR